MEFTVKAVGEAQEKSVQQVEQELLDKHESSMNEPAKETEVNLQVDSAKEEVNLQVDKTEPSELNEEDVLSFIGKKYGKQINSLDEFTREREEAEPLPEDVAAYFKYKKETGRSIEDFIKLNRDLDEINPDKLLRDYLTETEKGLDEEDIESLMEDYSYDEELDDESTIKKAKLAKKKMVAKAKEYFESQKEKYRIPVESTGNSISKEDSKALEEYRQYVQESMSLSEQLQKREQWFKDKTSEVFGSEFKGFEFALDDKKLVYVPGDGKEMLKVHQDPANFTRKFIGEDGLLTDPVGYHKALAVAMNPEKFAKFFYEQGKSEAVDDVMRKTKNIDMSTRSVPQNVNVGGTTIRAVNQDSGRGLRIKSNKN
jgi:hypothetical protein